jgi:hypothetical protein
MFRVKFRRNMSLIDGTHVNLIAIICAWLLAEPLACAPHQLVFGVYNL